MLNGHLNRGLPDFDRAHIFTAGYTYMLPFGRGQRFLSNVSGVARHIVEGWEFSGITLLESGLAFSPQLVNNAAINSDVSGVSLRPDRLPGVDPYDVSGGQNRDRWFNIAAYKIPAPFQFGNSSRGSLRGPGLVEADWSLGKRFPVAEQKSLQLRWEVFNVLNRANLANPNSNIDAGMANAARITNIVIGSTMRQMQIGLRFDW